MKKVIIIFFYSFYISQEGDIENILSTLQDPKFNN